MAYDVIGSVSGLKAIEKKLLHDLPIATSRKVVVSALRKSAQPMLNAARAFARKTNKSGALSYSIGIKTTPRSKSKFASIHISPGRGTARAYKAWALWRSYHKPNRTSVVSVNEFGSQPGDIRHGHLVERGFIHPKSGRHTRATPFLRPALDAHALSFENTFADDILHKMKKALTKGVRQ